MPSSAREARLVPMEWNGWGHPVQMCCVCTYKQTSINSCKYWKVEFNIDLIVNWAAKQ